MRLPRDISGADLSRGLRRLGYIPSRQSGSHIRLTTDVNGQHHVTIPKHNPLKLGTMVSILDDVAQHQNLSREELITLLRL